MIDGSPADSRQEQSNTVGQERLGLQQPLQVGPVHPPGIGDLAIREFEWSLVHHLETSTEQRHRVVVEGQSVAIVQDGDVVGSDADLLGQFTMRCGQVVLTRGHHSSHRDVAPARPHILGDGPTVNEKATPPVGHGHEDRSMTESVGTHRGATDPTHDAILFVDDVDEFIHAVGRHRALHPDDHAIGTF